MTDPLTPTPLTPKELGVLRSAIMQGSDVSARHAARLLATLDAARAGVRDHRPECAVNHPEPDADFVKCDCDFIPPHHWDPETRQWVSGEAAAPLDVERLRRAFIEYGFDVYGWDLDEMASGVAREYAALAPKEPREDAE